MTTARPFKLLGAGMFGSVPASVATIGCILAVMVTLMCVHMASAAELLPRGVYYWRGDHPDFGGFSGLAMAADGSNLMAVSDTGTLWLATVRRNAGGRIETIVTEWHGRFLDNSGNPVDDFKSDAEALAVAPDGTVYVGFEGYARVAAFHPPDMMPEPQHDWDRFRDLWGNNGIEALALRPEGGLLAILEDPSAAGEFSTFRGDRRDWRSGPVLPAAGGYAASDATFGPDGRLYVLERRFAFSAGYATRIRRFAYSGGHFGAGETLLSTPPGMLDNMEGISLWQVPDGQTVISLISDDNFLPIQNTLVVEYDLVE